MAQHGMAWHGMAWHVKAWISLASLAEHRRSKMGEGAKEGGRREEDQAAVAEACGP